MSELGSGWCGGFRHMCGKGTEIALFLRPRASGEISRERVADRDLGQAYGHDALNPLTSARSPERGHEPRGIARTSTALAGCAWRMAIAVRHRRDCRILATRCRWPSGYDGTNRWRAGFSYDSPLLWASTIMVQGQRADSERGSRAQNRGSPEITAADLQIRAVGQAYGHGRVC